MREKILIYLKGCLMGICDLIPGISGGTIAFITGIYTRLINAIKNISPKLILDLLRYITKRKEKDLMVLKQDIKKVDLPFLIVLGLGIATSILVGSRIVTYLLENYFRYVISFFIGLILASSKIIFDHIENHQSKNVAFGFFGLVGGILLSVLIPAKITPTLGYVFIGGFFAISAMFLPGISGAFILLILGIYEFMLNVLHDIVGHINYFFAFIVGAGLGAFSISRVISFLFKKDRCKTLYFLLGLVIGCLSIPIKNVYNTTGLWTIPSMILVIILLFFGILTTVIVNRAYGSKRDKWKA